MKSSDPLQKSKSEYSKIIDQIGSTSTPVGIDAQYTHAIIIEYLSQLDKRLERLESLVEKITQTD